MSARRFQRYHLLFGIILLLAATAAGAARFTDRIVPGRTTRRVEVKFTEGSGVRIDGDRLCEPDGRLLSGWERLRRAFGPFHVRPVFSRNPERLKADARTARERLRRPVADPTLYYRFTLDTAEKVRDFIETMVAREDVETAYPVYPPEPCEALDPVPDFSPQQTYLFSDDPGGPHLAAAWAYAGGRGDGVTIADIEYDVNRFHVDLDEPLGDASCVIGGEPDPGDNGAYRHHGTAVAGMLVAEDDGEGVVGIVPDGRLKICYVTLNGVPNIADAVDLSRSALSPGDILLVEMQVPGPHSTGGNQDGFLPAEWLPSVFTAIQLAVAGGVTVVEPAGNGRENLDDPDYDGYFDPSEHDSGAIIAGAGRPFQLTPYGYSNYGSRVDLQGWGGNVWSCGYGDAWGDPHGNDAYTADFSGTSSAAAMVAAAAAAYQGAYRNITGTTASPEALRKTLIDTGIAQGSGPHIGPLPDIDAAIRSIPHPTPTPTAVAVDLILNQESYTTGDTFRLSETTFNPGSDTAVLKYLVLYCYGQYYFWDAEEETFTENYAAAPDILPPGRSEELFFDFIWPEGDFGAVDGNAFFFCYTDLFTGELVGNWDACCFAWY